MTTLSATERSAAITWETTQFSTGPSDGPGPAGDGISRVSVRAAYQLLLYRRAVLVDARSSAVRRAEGEVHPSLRPMRLEAGAAAFLAVLRGGKRVLVLADDGGAPMVGSGAGVVEVSGGMRAWREAGLPLAA